MAFGNASAERAAIELTYEDTATVSRTTSQKGKNNISVSSPSVIYDGIICALSYTGSDNSRQTDAQNNVDYDAVIFASPDLLVLPGDTIVVKRFGRDDPSSGRNLTFEVIGRPSVYATHQEIKVKDGDKMGTAATRAKNKWQKQNVDRVNLTMPKGKKEQIQAHAQVCGESVNGFINRAISEAMERDNAAPGPAEGLADTEGGDA